MKSDSDISFFDFLPVLVATTYASRTGNDFEAWKKGFILGTVLVAIQWGFYRYRKMSPINPIAIGVNWFLVIGAFAFGFYITPLLTVYDNLRESVSFVFIALVGIYYFQFKPEGFIGHANSFTKKYSLVLIGVTVLCLLISYYFRGNQLISTTLTFLVLFLGRSQLRKKSIEEDSRLL